MTITYVPMLTVYYTVAEAAKLKGVSRQSIYNAIDQDRIRSVVQGDRAMVFCDAKFAKWLPDSKKQAAGKVAAETRRARNARPKGAECGG